MKKFVWAVFFCLLLSSVSNRSGAQAIDSMMNIYADQFQQEKIHLHFDKALYNKGETIWYKAYVLAGTDLAYYSKNFYADWYDASGRLISHTVAPLFQSTAKGAFEIPANYAGQVVHVKAYTQWMLNFDSAFLYQRDIVINQPNVPKPKGIIETTHVQLFPEGGYIINSLTSRIAFKAVNGYGNPVYIKGALKNNKNELIDSFAAEHDGMGSFSLETKPGETYYISWIDENGKTGNVNLPPAKESGAGILVQPADEKAVVLVERAKNADEKYKTLYLIAHMNQQMVYKSRINFSVQTNAVADIPTDQLPTGILQITLFNSDWIPIAERIVFVNNQLHIFNPRLTTPLVNLGKRAKNVIELFVSDTAFTNMSVAVTDADVLSDEKNNIYSDLLLSDDIKGKIYNPAYYFSSDADSVAKQLDLVLLTNGWRRYNWDDIAKEKLPVIKYPRETGYLKVKGKVYGSAFTRTSNQPFLNVIMQAKDSSKQFLVLPVTKEGSFEQDGVFFYDTVRMYYMFNGSRNLTDRTEVRFENGLFNQPDEKLKIAPYAAINNWSDSIARQRLKYFYEEQERLKKLMAASTLKEVTVRAKVKSVLQQLDEKYASGLFSGGDGYSFDVGDDTRASGAIDIFTYLQGQVAGLQIINNGGPPSLSWRGGTPDLYLDEVPAQPDMLQNTPITDIAYVKVFRPPFFGSIGGGSAGAIAVYTKKGTDRKKNYAGGPGLESSILGGYSRFKEFYSPDYEKPTDNFDPDLRTTIYWNPYVLTNKKSPKVKLEFYNNDISKKLRIILEGINGDGKLTRVEKVIE